MTAVHRKVGSVPHAHAALGDLALQFPAVVTLPLLLHLTAGTGVARLPLVVLPGPTWLGGLLGVPHCRHVGVHLLIIGGAVDLPGAVSHHLRPAPGALIVGWPYHPPGRLHLKGIGPLVPLHSVTAPGLPARSVSLTLMIQTFTSCDSVRTMMTSIPPVLRFTWFPWPRTIYLSGWISVVRGKRAETFCWSHNSSSSLALCGSHTW